jgi:hypothetical protein
MKTTSNTIRWLGLALTCGTLTFAINTQAGKPAKPPPQPSIEPGIVFYAQNGYVKAANSDGTGVHNLFALADMWETPKPSCLPHGGDYWFLTVRDEGSGTALFAIGENGFEIRLETGPTVAVVDYDGIYDQRWVPGDSTIAFVGSPTDPSDPLYGFAALYLMDIDWSSGLPVAAGAPQPLVWTALMVSGGSQTWGGCAFSSDGGTIYYGSAGNLYKADVATGSPIGPLASNFEMPELSSDGSRLLGYQVPGDVLSVNGDGTGLITVVAGSGDPFGNNPIMAQWSPSGANVVYSQYTKKGGGAGRTLGTYYEQVTIVSASGAAVGTIGDKIFPTWTLGWRPAR